MLRSRLLPSNSNILFLSVIGLGRNRIEILGISVEYNIYVYFGEPKEEIDLKTKKATISVIRCRRKVYYFLLVNKHVNKEDMNNAEIQDLIPFILINIAVIDIEEPVKERRDTHKE